jgi:hypothetical protein
LQRDAKTTSRVGVGGGNGNTLGMEYPRSNFIHCSIKLSPIPFIAYYIRIYPPHLVYNYQQQVSQWLPPSTPFTNGLCLLPSVSAPFKPRCTMSKAELELSSLIDSRESKRRSRMKAHIFLSHGYSEASFMTSERSHATSRRRLEVRICRWLA